MNVYVVCGWFGSEEWTESVWEHEADADAETTRLWQERRSERLPADHYVQGLCKFGVEEWPVQVRAKAPA